MFFQKRKRFIRYNNAECAEDDCNIILLYIIMESRLRFYVASEQLYPTLPDGLLVQYCSHKPSLWRRQERFWIRKDHPRIINYDRA